MTNRLAIVVVGSGLAGLLAALRLGRDGHYVKVLERREQLSDRGGGLMIRSNATQHLVEWGLRADFEAVAETVTTTAVRNLVTGDIVEEREMESFSAFPTWALRRQAVQEILYCHASDTKGVDIRFGVEVVDVRVDEGMVSLRDGSVVEADLVIAADGVRSKLRKLVVGDVAPVLQGKTGYQTSAPMEDVMQHPQVSEIADSAGTCVWVGQGRHLVTAGGLKAGVWVADFVIDESENGLHSDALWQEHGDIEYVRRIMHDVDPRVKAHLANVSGCSRWVLSELPDLPTWVRGKMILLGDSAHAMVPSGAQGLSQIIEDVAALSRLLLRVQGPEVEGPEVARITQIWQEFRMPRVERIRAFASARMSNYQSKPSTLSAKSSSDVISPTSSSRMDADFASSEFLRWQYDYDLARELDQYLEHRGTGIGS